MKRFLPLLILFPFAFWACDDAPPPPPEEQGDAGGGISHSSGQSGGGQVKIGGGQNSRETIAERYQRALAKIKKRDWDGAREDLVEALHRSRGHPIHADIQKHLKIVEQGILAQPAHNVGDVFNRRKALFEKKLSIRGTLFTGGKVGKVTYYFWTQTGRDKIQCRYPKLDLEDKRTILLLKDGAQVLVRGTLKSPWGSNPDPYLDLSYFRLEKLGAEQQAQMDKRNKGGK